MLCPTLQDHLEWCKQSSKVNRRLPPQGQEVMQHHQDHPLPVWEPEGLVAVVAGAAGLPALPVKAHMRG
jgi:hypothetical protein